MNPVFTIYNFISKFNPIRKGWGAKMSHCQFLSSNFSESKISPQNFDF